MTVSANLVSLPNLHSGLFPLELTPLANGSASISPHAFGSLRQLLGDFVFSEHLGMIEARVGHHELPALIFSYVSGKFFLHADVVHLPHLELPSRTGK